MASAAAARRSDIALSHKLPGCTGVWSRVEGLVSLATVWIGCFFLGPLSPLIIVLLIRAELTLVATVLGAWILK